MSSAHLVGSFETSPGIICLVVMIYVRCPLSLRNVEDLLHKRGIDMTHETIRFWWNRIGTTFEAGIRRSRRARPCVISSIGAGSSTSSS